MLIRRNVIIYLPKRWKSRKIHWADIERKKFNKDRALDHFDDFYGSLFGNYWKNIRVALLTEHKYVALVNNFGDVESTSNSLELNGAINIKSLVDLSKERLLNESKRTFNDRNVYKLDHTLDEIIRRKEENELLSLYPPKANVQHQQENLLIKHSDSNNENASETEKENELNAVKEFRKPLESVLQEDFELDERRFIDPSIGTGALHEFIPATKIKGLEDWIPESDHYKYYSTNTDFPISIDLEKEFKFPENLHLYTYESGNCSDFIPPRKCITGVYSHFLMDGASILPPIFLDVQKGDKVLDACAAPGGKSLILLEALQSDVLVLNDIQESRINRIKSIMHQYVCDYRTKWDGKRCFITQSDARAIDHYEMYDKILVDVPCTTDRHSVMENDNNIFKTTRIKERFRIPELQSAILVNCLRLLKSGGSLVYSTCSLSPVQNDGVVHMSLQKAFNEYGVTVTVKDLSFVTQYFMDIFKFENSKTLKYGQMVLPYLPANFGPMYFCKMTRI